MGQKVNPVSLRIGAGRLWDSKWFASKKDFNTYLYEDYKIRTFLEKSYRRAFISKIEISRFPQQINVSVFASKPGILIGRKGAEIELITKKLTKLLDNKKVFLSIKELKSPEHSAKVVAEDIAQQIERRVAYKRAVRQAIRNVLKSGAKGIKIRVSGRLNGVEIARSEEFKEGPIPLSTIKANIDYSLAEAKTDMGILGVKVWIYLG